MPQLEAPRAYDGSRQTLRFEIYRYTAKGYTSVRKQDGWIKSAVSGKSFKLTCQAGSSG
jgi:hypothetical protein